MADSKYPPFTLGKSRFDQVVHQWMSSPLAVLAIIAMIFANRRNIGTTDAGYLHYDILGYLYSISLTGCLCLIICYNIDKLVLTESTFLGRFRHFLDVTDPRTLFVTEAQLQDAIKLLNDYKNDRLPDGVTNEQLWKAQKIKQAIIHPDTNEKIFMPFRMSGFVPFGTPIVVGLLLPNQTIKSIIFWQWLNQSHNAGVNYANRNASKPTPVSEFIGGYVAAVTSAVGIALGLTSVIKKADRLSPATRTAIQRFVPFPAVASASVCNVLFMRRSELSRGIEVVDKDGNPVGTSQVAAKKALFEMACTRAFLPAPILLIPAFAMQLMEKTRFLKANPRFHLPLNAIVCTFSFGLALPLAISLFPQMSSIETKDLEENIRSQVKDKILYYNKGL